MGHGINSGERAREKEGGEKEREREVKEWREREIKGRK